MKKNRLLSILLALCCLSVLPSCIKEKEKSWIDSSNGATSIKAPAYALRNQLVKMEVTGLNWPLEPKYTWAFGTTLTDTLVGNPIIARVPDSLGAFPIYVKIVEDGFFDTNVYGSVITVDTSAVNNSLTGRIFGPNTYLDPRDQRIYHTTTIGNLEWFAENLAWDGVGKVYKNAEVLKYFVGRIYTWDEATGGVSKSGLGNGPQGACPPGWSVPTAEDWEDFGAALNNGEAVEFLKTWYGLGQKVTVDAYFNSSRMWEYSPDHVHGNMFNWNAIPAGYSIFNNTIAKTSKDYGLWWCSTEKDENLAYYRSVYSQLPDFNVNYGDKDDLRISIRCVRKL